MSLINMYCPTNIKSFILLFNYNNWLLCVPYILRASASVKAHVQATSSVMQILSNMKALI